MRLHANITLYIVKDTPLLIAYRVALAEWQFVAKQRKVRLVRRASNDHRFSVYGGDTLQAPDTQFHLQSNNVLTS